MDKGRSRQTRLMRSNKDIGNASDNGPFDTPTKQGKTAIKRT